MAGTKEIRTKIKSIKNTQKITRAMEMVAASKMRKAQERMSASRPYAQYVRRVIGHLANARPEYVHQFMQDRPELRRVGLIVVSTDRGLCGGLNTNLFKATIAAMESWKAQGAAVDLCLIGSKAEAFFKRLGGNIVAHADHLGDQPALADLIGTVKVMLDRYTDFGIDRLYIVSNQFINTMTQKPVVEQLLPFERSAEEDVPAYEWDYLYEPDPRLLIDTLAVRFIESQVYQGVIENIACEQAARMVAMKAASDNAGDLINELQLVYNKARQASITKELSEIIAGAEAV